MSAKLKLKQLLGGSVAGHIITSSAGAVSVLRHNLSAASGPLSSNDVDEGYGVGSVWVDLTNDRAYLCVDAGTPSANTAIWRMIGSNDRRHGERSGAEMLFSSGTTPYVNVNTVAPTYSTIGYFVFAGTNIHNPEVFRFIGSRSAASGSSNIRLYDETNALQIALINYTATGVAIYSSALTNLPTGQAVFSIQANRSGSGGVGNTRLHFAELK